MYFKKMCTKWKSAWHDQSQQGHQIKMWNTNNIVESLFKKVIAYFFHQCKAKSIESAIYIWVSHFIFNVKFQHIEDSIMKQAPTTLQLQLAQCQEQAQALLEDDTTLITWISGVI